MKTKILLYTFIIALFSSVCFGVSKSTVEPPSGKAIDTISEQAFPEDEEDVSNEPAAATNNPIKPPENTSKQLRDSNDNKSEDKMEAPRDKNNAKLKIGIYPNKTHLKPRPRPRPIIIPLRVSIWTDNNLYRIGDNVRIYFRVSRSAYVYIFNTDAQGITRQIFPNYYDRDNYVYSNQTYYIPDANYSLKATGPKGRESLQIVAVAQRYSFFNNYHSYRSAEPFPRTPDGGKRIIDKMKSSMPEDAVGGDNLNASPKSSKLNISPGAGATIYPYNEYYAEDWAFFDISGRYYDYNDDDWDKWDDYDYDDYDDNYNFGELYIKTDPSGARIEIDNNYRGKTPFKARLRPGYYRISIEKSGYKTWYSSVRIKGDCSTQIKSKLIRKNDSYYNERYDYNDDVDIKENNRDKNKSDKH